MNNVGQKLKIARLKKGYTQTEVSKDIGIQRTSLSKIENGTYEPSLEQLQELINLYEVNANWVLDTEMTRKDN